MTDQSPGTALALPADTELATIFRTEGAVDPIIARIEAEVRAHVPDLTTAKGRDAVKSLAYKVSRSKTALDEAGKKLNEDARAQIAVVDAARKRIRDRLDALRDEARKPLDDWEAAEETRINALRDRLAALDAGRADEHCETAQISDVLAEIEATEIGDDWQEYQGQAAIAKGRALTTLRRNLQIASQREADAAELERLRLEQARRDEEDRQRREAEDAAARLADRATKARAYIEEVGAGRIGGRPQPFGVLIYELESKLPDLIDQLGKHASDLHALRRDTLAGLVSKMDEQRQRDDAKAESDRKAAAEKAAIEAKAQAEREAEEAAQRERDRLAAERRAEEEAQKRREENTRIRNRVKREIAAAFAALPQPLTHDDMADALIAGRIAHCKVSF